MHKVPLQLDGYVFTKLLVEANSEYNLEEQQEISQSEIDFSLGIVVGKDKDNPLLYQIQIQIENLRAKKAILPYTIEARVVGVFSVDPDFKHDDLERLIQINGASMLFGAAREQILTLTGRGPFGPLKLPTINLLNVIANNVSSSDVSKETAMTHPDHPNKQDDEKGHKDDADKPGKGRPPEPPGKGPHEPPRPPKHRPVG